MSVVLKSNLKRFHASIAAIHRETKKDAAESLNRGLRNVAFRAAQYTPKADPAEIERELLNDKLALKIATKRLRSYVGTQYSTKRGIRTVSRVTRKQIGLRARQLIAKRKKNRGFLRAGWFASIVALGGSIRGSSSYGERRPELRWGGATKATTERLLGKIVNLTWDRLKGRAYGATKAKMMGALNRAVATVAGENEQYVKRKIDARLRRHSDR